MACFQIVAVLDPRVFDDLEYVALLGRSDRDIVLCDFGDDAVHYEVSLILITLYFYGLRYRVASCFTGVYDMHFIADLDRRVVACDLRAAVRQEPACMSGVDADYDAAVIRFGYCSVSALLCLFLVLSDDHDAYCLRVLAEVAFVCDSYGVADRKIAFDLRFVAIAEDSRQAFGLDCQIVFLKLCDLAAEYEGFFLVRLEFYGISHIFLFCLVVVDFDLVSETKLAFFSQFVLGLVRCGEQHGLIVSPYDESVVLRIYQFTGKRAGSRLV